LTSSAAQKFLPCEILPIFHSMCFLQLRLFLLLLVLNSTLILFNRIFNLLYLLLKWLFLDVKIGMVGFHRIARERAFGSVVGFWLPMCYNLLWQLDILTHISIMPSRLSFIDMDFITIVVFWVLNRVNLILKTAIWAANAIL
jgi:hypothetical protein